MLAAGGDAEFGPLFDGVDGVTTGVREADNLGLGGLRLQQKRGKVGSVKRMADAAEHLAAIGVHHLTGVALERLAEGIVGGEKEPSVAAGLHHRLAGAIG